MPRTRKPTTYTPLEREIQRNGILLLRGLGWTVHRRNTGGMRWKKKDGSTGIVKFNEKSMADTWGTIPDGRRFECEFKQPNKRPTAKQLTWLKSQNNEHCCAFWVDNTKTLQEVATWLTKGWKIAWFEIGDGFDLINDQWSL